MAPGACPFAVPLWEGFLGSSGRAGKPHSSVAVTFPEMPSVYLSETHLTDKSSMRVPLPLPQPRAVPQGVPKIPERRDRGQREGQWGGRRGREKAREGKK